MATFTTNYDLIKPGNDDYYDIADFNENMDAIDGQLSLTEQEVTKVKEELEELKNGMGQNESLAAIDRKIGNSTDQTNTTVFGAIATHKKATDATSTKIGTSADQTATTVFGSIATQKKVTDAINEKIGTPSDSETLFSALKRYRQIYKYYTYENAPIKEQEAKTEIRDEVKNYKFKLHTFKARYNGSIRVKLQITGRAKNLNFYVTDAAPIAFMDMQSPGPITSSYTPEVYVYKELLYDNTDRTQSGDLDFILPVFAGHTYHFLIMGTLYSNNFLQFF